jgi:ribulose-5-phosphate 4-epimerase/fuculose-1-phosphate aldolase
MDLKRNPMGPSIPDLSPQAEVALLARLLFHEGYDDHLSGHITFRQPDGTILATPWGLTWDEMCASDIMRMDADGNPLEGKWTITPAIPLHVELHKARHDVSVVVHNHPRYGTIWADLHRAPPVYDQTGSMIPDDPVVYDDFNGAVVEVDNAKACVEALGDGRMALLANHGVLVVGTDIQQAHHRSVFLEWRCRQAWHVEAIGNGVPVKDEVFKKFAAPFDYVSFPGLWEAMVRRELRRDPTVLD